MTAAGPGMAGIGAQVAEAFVRAHEALRPHNRKHADDRLTEWLDGWEQNMRDTIAPHLAEYVDHPDLPPQVRELFATVVQPNAAFDTSLLFAVIAALAYPLISAVMVAIERDLESTVWKGRQVMPLSPEAAVIAAIKAADTYANMETEASYNGISPGRFKIMHDSAGNPPGLGELLLLLRRRQINDLRFQQGIQESLLRNDWITEFMDLKFSPPGVGSVIEGAVKNHLDDTTAAGMVSEAGIDPANYTWLKASAGRPPGIQEMVQLWNRTAAGLPGFTVSQTDVEDAVHQSDINDRFLPFVLESRWYQIPVRSILPMLRAGAIDDAKASQLLAAHGVRPEDIPSYLAEGSKARTNSVKELSVAQTLRMYETRIITAADATLRIEAHGYNATDSALMLQYADDSRHEKAVNALVSRIQSLYVNHAIDATQVTNDLGAAGLPGAAVADYLNLWTLERTANVHRLTPAAIVGAYRRTDISAADCKTRLLNAGVQPGDIGIVVADGFPPTKPNPAAVAAVVNA